MYFNDHNNFFHGIMFHHFHDDGIHTKGQGSISKDDFYKMLDFIGKKNILDADVFYERLKENKLEKNQVCLTFDDGIKCQIDIALPILEELKVKAFFFVYTSMFERRPDHLEVFRYFRMNYFNSVDDFYKDFYKVLDKDLKSFFEKNEKQIQYTKSKLPLYSKEDIKFRLVRDIFLSRSKYDKIMYLMMKEKKFDFKSFYSRLFFCKSDLKKLSDLGHLVGLHSHSHPTLIEKLSYDEQKLEYEKCLSSISKILEKPSKEINCMAHPCGSYNNDTLNILKELGIDLGFRQMMATEPKKGINKVNNSLLEIAREDHAKIFKMMSL